MEDAQFITFLSALIGGGIAAIASIVTIIIGRIFDERRERRKMVFDLASAHYKGRKADAQVTANGTGRPQFVEPFEDFIVYADEMCRIVEGKTFKSKSFLRRSRGAKELREIISRNSDNKDQNGKQDIHSP
ncbi:MAG: hypothetical protein AAF065_06400 [Verrucomicrobiota bacterium]